MQSGKEPECTPRLGHIDFIIMVCTNNMFTAVAYVIASPTLFLVVVPYKAVCMQPPTEITAKLQLPT